MKIYSDTELDNDIRYVKEVLSRYSFTYKDIEQNFKKLNKTVSGRLGFIASQFKNILGTQQKMWV